jgi:hypothetical protein
MHKIINFRSIISAVTAVAFVALFTFSLHIETASAAALTDLRDTMTRLEDSTGGDIFSDHDIEFTTPTGVASTETIVITFPAEFDGANDPQGALDFNDVDLLEDTTPDGVCDGTAETLVASGPAAGEWSAVFSGTEGRILTLTSGGATAIIAAASEVCVKIGETATGGAANSQYANPTTVGSAAITLSVGSSDSGTITVPIIDDDTVNVTANVNQTISFAISDTTIGFGDLDSGAARYATGDTNGTGSEGTAAHTLTAATNATSGYSITGIGATLTSGSDTITALSSETASSAGTEQFGLRIGTVSGGAGAADADFDSSPANNYNYGTFPSAADVIASSSSASATTTYDMHYLANITATTEAGSYATNITYIATAQF